LTVATTSAPPDFATVAAYIRAVTGIRLDEGKAYFVDARLDRLRVELDCASIGELCERARRDASRALERRIVDAVTVKETLFFRDRSPFEMLRHKILPDLIDRRSRTQSANLPIPVRIWSAACSTGQEVYSIAVVLRELLDDFSRYRIQLLGTDISDEAVTQASYGAYNRFEVERGLTPPQIQRYFKAEGSRWRVNDELRAMATFRQVNLLAPLTVGRFDIVFCRNVAIYFEPDVRRSLFERIADVLAPDGFLVIGATESLMGVTERYRPHKHINAVYYQPQGGKGA
jgi:chemotaxis protein methyltransferase CheR